MCENLSRGTYTWKNTESIEILTIEATIENGEIRLLDDVTLPDSTKVYYIVVPGVEAPLPIHIRSPRLSDPKQASDFRKQVIKVSPGEGV